MLIAAICLGLAFSQLPGRVTAFVALLGTGCMIAFAYYASVYATIQEIVPPSLRGTAMALYFLAMYLLGGSFGPVLTGKLSDYFAHRAMAAAGASAMNEHFRASGLHAAMLAIPAVRQDASACSTHSTGVGAASLPHRTAGWSPSAV